MLNEEHLLNVLKQVADQVANGKGQERHGHGLNLEQQPWKTITDNVGEGFLVGQALKKLMELRTFTPKNDTSEECQKAYRAWEREALGAIAYTAMAIMYRQCEQEIKLNKT